MASGYSSTYITNTASLRDLLREVYADIENNWPAEFTETRILSDERGIITAITVYGITTQNSNHGIVDWSIASIGGGNWRFAIVYQGTTLASVEFSASGTYTIPDNGEGVTGTITIDLTNIGNDGGKLLAMQPYIMLDKWLGTGRIFQEVRNRLLKNPSLPEARKEYLVRLVDKSVLETAEVYACLMLIFQNRFRVVGDVAYDLYQEFKRRLDDEMDRAPIQWDSTITVTISDSYEESPNVTWFEFAG